MESIRLVTLNMWGEQPPLDKRMEIIMRGLVDLRPDVVALQEVREVPGKMQNQAQTIADRCGYRWCWAPATEWGGGMEGVALLSRHPIGETAHVVLPASIPTETRVVLMARIDTPTGPLHCYTTHLNYRLTHGLQREQQIVAVDDFVKTHASDLPKFVMGDFNATPEHDEIRFLRGLHTLADRRVVYQDAYARRHPIESEAGYTWARRNPYTERLRWLERDRRIDYIFLTSIDRQGRGVVHDCRLVFDSPDSEGCYASDHFGLLADVQIAAMSGKEV